MHRRDFLHLAVLAGAYQALGQIGPIAPSTDLLPEMERRLQPLAADSVKSVKDDALYQPIMDKLHAQLTATLNKDRPGADIVMIPKPHLMVFSAPLAKVFSIPASNDPGETSFIVGRTRNLETILDKIELESALAHELTHLALKSDKTSRTLSTLLNFVELPQREAFSKLLQSDDPAEKQKGRDWLIEFLADQGARLATCSDAIYQTVEKIDVYNEAKYKKALGNLYPAYQKLSPAEQNALDSRVFDAADSGVPDGHPPDALRHMGKPLRSQNFCPSL